MSLVRQPITKERVIAIQESLRVMAIIMQVIKMEYYADMDVNFKNPLINQFAGRILKDIEQIKRFLKSYNGVKVEFPDADLAETYAGELYRVIHFFARLPATQIKDVMDNLYEIAETEGSEV